MLTIDGLVLPTPAALKMSYESVGRMETTADGALAADRLAVKRRVSLTWRGLGRTEAMQILSALTDGVLLTVALPDPKAGAQASLTMILVSLDADLLTVESGGSPGCCRDITAVLRER